MDTAQSPENQQTPPPAAPGSSTPPAPAEQTPVQDPSQTTPPGATPPPGTPSPVGSKKFMYLIMGVVVFILLLIIIAIAAASKSSKQVQQKQSNVSAITPTKVPTPTTNPLPTQNLSPEVDLIKNQAKPQIDAKVNGNPYTIAFVKLYTPTWAIAEITNPTTDPANIVLKKVNGYWNIVLGPGTYFDADTLNTLGAPSQLINDANTVFVQPNISPSAGQ